ncbi:MAG: alpha/beta hydrolase [Ruminococcus sp.]|nr:alpha/beta hydrolase [Ruminococcus sp.]MBQ4170078.1 alpha/beta hydrolase [Ruminococcus sp.]MBQ4261501.1 alpha/beta hydrolase [Ruminococcus sp.]
MTRAFSSRQYDADIGKLVLTGSPSRSDKIRQGLQVVKLLKKLEGKRARSLLAKKLIMGVSYERRYRHEGLHNAWTNSEREAVIEHNNDPLCRFNFTLNGYEEMLKMAMLAYTGGYTPQNPAMPIRFFSGEDDPCALSRQKFAEAMRLMKNIGYTDVRCLLYKGMRHDILHEKNKLRVYSDILRFIETGSTKPVTENNGQTP